MRTDTSVSRISFRFSDQWRTDPFAGMSVPEIDRRLEGFEVVDGKMMIHSLSGHERNHLFLNQQGKRFRDLSLVSGIDNPADSRGFVLFDYDHDGQLDIALVNANDPLLNLYHNQFAQVLGNATTNRSIALRFVGGNHRAGPSSLACRDGFGAMVSVKLASGVLKREHRCGEGYGTQNSATMTIGIGANEQAESVHVRWPSGRESHIDNVAAGSLVIVEEDPMDGADAIRLARLEPVELTRHQSEAVQSRLLLGELQSVPPLTAESPRRPRLYVTTATWCTACVEHLPHMRHLAQQLGADVEIIGLPIDPEDDVQKLEHFATQFNWPYPLVLQLTPEQRNAVARALSDVFPSDAVPASIITDADGTVMKAMAGVPTLSEIRQALAADPL